ncbi:MAG: DUF5106 domain-containing protein, partial [Muribaculaceae bacterium]|nr:DUF5106 domain-containing protein [Muribaculaceae bacterium]
NLIDKVKKRPADLLELANMAEGMFYDDTARLPIDLAYLPFAKAVAANKKINATQRDKFAIQASVIENSQPGKPLPPAELKLADGTTLALNDTTAGANEYVLIFDTPGSWSGRMQRTQLAANVSASELIAANLIKPIFIYPGTPDEKWWTDNADVPANWTVAAMPDAERYIDFRVVPAIVVADSGKVITEKFMTMSHLIQACELIMNQYRNQ